MQFSQVEHGPAFFVGPGAILRSNNHHSNTTRGVATIITVFEKRFVLPGRSMKEETVASRSQTVALMQTVSSHLTMEDTANQLGTMGLLNIK